MAEADRAGRALKGNGVEICERFPLACVNLRGAPSDARFFRAVTSVTDVPPPTQPCTSVAGLFVSILWLGPDEWLVISETQRGDEIAARLRQALRGIHSAVNEVGDGRIVCALSGVAARSVLAKGCPIDLHPRAFPTGQCVRTLLAKASVLIHARAADSFEVHVARSFADYAWAWFENATAEYR
jgi:sarcosine oxidase subunit gamma